MSENLSAISQAPVQRNTKPSSVCSISSQMRSMALKNEASSKGYNSGSLFESAMSDWDFFFGGNYPTKYYSSYYFMTFLQKIVLESFS